MSNFFSKTTTDITYAFTNKKHLSKKEQKRKKRGMIAVAGLFLVLIQLIATVLFMLDIIKLNMLPVKYTLMLITVLTLLWFYTFTTQFGPAHIWGKILSVFLSIVMIFAYFVTSKVNATFNNIDSNKHETNMVNVIVLASDNASDIKDTFKYTYGYNNSGNTEALTKAIDDVSYENKVTINTKTFDSWDTLISALYDNKTVKAIVMTEATQNTIKDQFEDFETKTKVVGSIEITTEIKMSESDKKVNEECFTIFISGEDDEGSVSSVGHSDVNIIATINPVTRQVLLVSTPRDFYVEMESSITGKTGLDKLTHAGNDGTENTINTLEKLYGIDIDYYYRINFTGCIDVVDALGGITINSEVEFDNGWEACWNGYHFNKGLNECDGTMTLAFVRERKAFPDGDFQRGRNQTAAITAIINKITSPAIITSYGPLLDAVSNMFITNMSTDVITALVRGQLADTRGWTIQSYSAEAIDSMSGIQPLEVWGGTGWVAYPDYNSVNTAIKLMNKIKNGEVFSVDDYLNSAASGTTGTTETTQTTIEAATSAESSSTKAKE